MNFKIKTKQDKFKFYLLLALPAMSIFLFSNPITVLATEDSVSKTQNSLENTSFNSIEKEVATTIKEEDTQAVTFSNIGTFEKQSNLKKLFNFDDYKNIGIVTSFPAGLDNCPIFSQANVTSSQIGKINMNGVCTILAEDGDWYQIQSGTVTGYIMKIYVIKDTDALLKSYEITNEIARANDKISFYESPFDGTTVLNTYEKGTEFTVSEKYEGWLQVINDKNEVGYLEENKITLLPKLSEAEIVENQEKAYTTETTNNETRIVVAEGSVAGNYVFEDGTTGFATTDELRQQIVNYACSFIGNPYVWGGTDPNTGADCSGFVQYVYAHFGYSIPRTTYAQWDWAVSNGRVIDPSEAQAGDLVLYNGHVTMLTGNGAEIVHASNSAPYPQGGIKITSNYNYQPILGIVRVID